MKWRSLLNLGCCRLGRSALLCGIRGRAALCHSARQRRLPPLLPAPPHARRCEVWGDGGLALPAEGPREGASDVEHWLLSMQRQLKKSSARSY